MLETLSKRSILSRSRKRKKIGMQSTQALLDVVMQAQFSFIVISTLAMAAGIATAGKTQRVARKDCILKFCLACLLIFPSFFVLKSLLFPELDFSDPNPNKAALLQTVRLMGIASIPTILLMGRYTAYRNRDVGNTNRMAYLAAVPVVGSIWMLRLLTKPSAVPAS
jgi:uncharacterized membrane protein YhaH (DUF805 family)